jgi:hypothetical protein
MVLLGQEIVIVIRRALLGQIRRVRGEGAEKDWVQGVVEEVLGGTGEEKQCNRQRKA